MRTFTFSLDEGSIPLPSIQEVLSADDGYCFGIRIIPPSNLQYAPASPFSGLAVRYRTMSGQELEQAITDTSAIPFLGTNVRIVNYTSEGWGTYRVRIYQDPGEVESGSFPPLPTTRMVLLSKRYSTTTALNASPLTMAGADWAQVGMSTRSIGIRVDFAYAGAAMTGTNSLNAYTRSRISGADDVHSASLTNQKSRFLAFDITIPSGFNAHCRYFPLAGHGRFELGYEVTAGSASFPMTSWAINIWEVQLSGGQ